MSHFKTNERAGFRRRSFRSVCVDLGCQLLQPGLSGVGGIVQIHIQRYTRYLSADTCP